MHTTRFIFFTTAILLCLLSLFAIQTTRAAPHLQEPGPTPEPTLDRLAIPTLPENPTQKDEGIQVYYYHCMPCHGDYGQGLTEEFRNIWVEDHRDCWASGCHGGRERDEGFPIPRVIPGVQNLDMFSDPNSLFSYLQRTHPPQYPGALEEEQYWAVTALLFQWADRLSIDERLPAPSPQPSLTPSQPFSEDRPTAASRPSPTVTSQPAPTAGPPSVEDRPAASVLSSPLPKFAGLLALFTILLVSSLVLRKKAGSKPPE